MVLVECLVVYLARCSGQRHFSIVMQSLQQEEDEFCSPAYMEEGLHEVIQLSMSRIQTRTLLWSDLRSVNIQNRTLASSRQE